MARLSQSQTVSRKHIKEFANAADILLKQERRASMGIGPIVGIRPITMVKPLASAPDLTGVFAVEFRGQEQDETYSPSHQSANRGLEDEETEDDTLSLSNQQPAVENSVSFEDTTQRKVSFFA